MRLKQQVPPTEMLRLNAFCRAKAGTQLMFEYCAYSDEAGGFEIPLLAKLQSYSIVVCTCVSAALLTAAGMPAGHFTHVFVDECGHATQPEVCIPLAVAPGAFVVLSGDPKQLGPIIRSKVAVDGGLAMSLLERLIGLPAYTRAGAVGPQSASADFDPALITMLVKNYRSHPAILDLPSRIFYMGRLEPCADVNMREALCGWQGLPNRTQFPIAFHNVAGQDMREGDSPSFFNPEEVNTLVQMSFSHSTCV